MSVPLPGRRSGFDIVFCATSKSGLGHVRRLTNIAQELHRLRPGIGIALFTNGGAAALSEDEKALYRIMERLPRQEMAHRLRTVPHRCCVVDTAILPGLHRIGSRLCLILRETRPEMLDCFRLEEGRLWDLVLLPNPEDEWFPGPTLVGAHRMTAVGWIFRRPVMGTEILPFSAGTEEAVVLIATGGGGTGETQANLARNLERLLTDLRQAAVPMTVVQALGPRASPLSSAGIDRVIRPGASLNRWFQRSDLVVSTVGYNSVLELALCDTPALLMPIPRTFDDQTARARRWGPRLGWCYEPSRHREIVADMKTTLSLRRRRPPVRLPPSGAARAAEAILNLL